MPSNRTQIIVFTLNQTEVQASKDKAGNKNIYVSYVTQVQVDVIYTAFFGLLRHLTKKRRHFDKQWKNDFQVNIITSLTCLTSAFLWSHYVIRDLYLLCLFLFTIYIILCSTCENIPSQLLDSWLIYLSLCDIIYVWSTSSKTKIWLKSHTDGRQEDDVFIKHMRLY